MHKNLKWWYAWSVSIRALLIAVFCLAFLASRASGVHSHVSQSEEEDAGGYAESVHSHEHSHGHVERITVPYVEGAIGHFDSHVQGGEVDVDSPVVVGAKASLAKIVLALIGLVCVLLLGPSSVATAQRFPPRPPPRFPRRFHLLPPSHAPPRFA